jgi:two-component system chemotaxis response regulator CheB
MPARIRVLVVDDSALIRQMLTRALSMEPRIEVVGIAKTGVEAIAKAQELSPDVVTLDIEMPELTGLEALPHIRKHSDARVVMLSSLDDPETTYRALSLGAVDFLTKPHGGMAGSINELAEVLIKKIKIAHRVAPRRHAEVVERVGVVEPPIERLHVEPPSGPLAACVGIAASTGGPPALERVFSGLSAAMPAAYVIVQHLPAGFSASLAKRLNAVSEVPVVEARHGMALEPGHAYVAPHGHHVVVDRDDGVAAIRFDPSPPQHGVRPAADLLFFSIAEHLHDRAIGVVLTGMGADGARGLLAIKEAGGDTVAQDEPTSVVWGMPGTAMRMGAASRVVPIGLVAAEIRRSIRARAESGVL